MKKLFFISVLVLFPCGIWAAQLDMGVVRLDFEKYYYNDVDHIVVSGRVRNFGTETINSFRISYQVNNGEIFDFDVSNVTLIQNGERAFTHPEPIDPVVGDHIVKVWTSLPNGQQDEDPDNDAMTANYVVYDANDYVQRTILVEGFTSSTCPPCVAGNINLKARLEQNTGSYALIKYQMSWPGSGDPYYTHEAGARRTYYGVNSVPWCFVEGPGWSGNSASVTETILANAQNVPTFMEVVVDFYVEGQTVYAKTKVESKFDASAQNLRLYVAVVEKLTYLNRYTVPNEWNGEEEFQQVMKKFMPDANGIPLEDFKANVPFVNVQEWEFQGEYRRPNNANSPINHDIEHTVEDFGNLSIVAWVQNSQDRFISQAANGKDSELPTVEFRFLNDFGTISATIDGEPVASGDPINTGDIIIFTAIPQEGYEVKEWKVNGVTVPQKNSNSIEVEAENFVDVSVEFQAESAIDDKKVTNISLYPNPFKNEIFVNSEYPVINIQIFNATGQKVKEVVFNQTIETTKTIETIKTIETSETSNLKPETSNPKQTIETSNLSCGVYFVIIENNKREKLVHKMVKK